MAYNLIERRARAIARARRRLPTEALLIDALAVAYIEGHDPESVAADLYARGVTPSSLRHATFVLILEGVVSDLAEWPGDVRYTLDWHYEHAGATT